MMAKDLSSPIYGHYEQVILDRFKVAAVRRLSRQLIESARVSTYADFVTQDLIVDLHAAIYAHKIAQDTIERDAVLTVDMPTSPWQFFKDAHAGSWWLSWFTNRWPAKTRKIVQKAHFRVDVRKFNAFPDSSIRYPDELGAPIRWIDYRAETELT